jgi:hypothetical protein
VFFMVNSWQYIRRRETINLIICYFILFYFIYYDSKLDKLIIKSYSSILNFTQLELWKSTSKVISFDFLSLEFKVLVNYPTPMKTTCIPISKILKTKILDTPEKFELCNNAYTICVCLKYANNMFWLSISHGKIISQGSM